MGRSRRHDRGGRSGGGRNSNSNPRNSAPHEARAANTDTRVKPTLPGAEHIIFSIAEGAEGSKGDAVFTRKIETMAMCLVNHPALKKGGAVDVSQALEALEAPTFTRPTKPKLSQFKAGDDQQDNYDFAVKKYEAKCDELIAREKQFETENMIVYNILYQHCSQGFWNQLKNGTDFKQIENARDGIRLAKLMQNTYITGGVEQHEDDVYENAASLLLRTCITKQLPHQSNEEFVQQSTAMIEALSVQGGFRFGHLFDKCTEVVKRKLKEQSLPADTTADIKNASTEIYEEAYAEVQEQFHVHLLLRLADQDRYGGFIATTRRNRLTSKVEWPKNRAALIVLLDKWENELRLEQNQKKMKQRQQQQQQQQQRQQQQQQQQQGDSDASGTPKKIEDGGGDAEKGPSFMQQQGKKTNKKGESHCHTCGAEDHWKNECPQNNSNDEEGVSGMEQRLSESDSDEDLWIDQGANFAQISTPKESDEAAKVYFDSCAAQATIDENELTNVRASRHRLKVLCNAGQMGMTHIGNLGELVSWARLDGQGIANLISIPRLEHHLRKHGGRLVYSSESGEWILTLRGQTAVLRRDDTGPCAGMPYMFVEEARTFFAPPVPQPVTADVSSTSQEEGWHTVPSQKRSRSEQAVRSTVQSSKKSRSAPKVRSILKETKWDKATQREMKQIKSTFVPVKTDGKNPSLVVTWTRPECREKARFVTSGDLHMQQSIRGNMEGYSKRQVRKAHEARLLQGCLTLPDGKFNELVRNNQLKGCNITIDDVSNAAFIYGKKARPNIRGGTTRTKPTQVTPTVVSVPKDFYKLHKFVTLYSDVMFVNGLPFLTTVSENIEFLTAEFLQNRKAKTLCSTLKKVMALYGKNGFVVRVVHMDNEFAPLKELLPNVDVELTAKGEHVCPIERQHRTIKNRARGVIAELLYLYLPTQMVIHLIYHVIMVLNATNFKLSPTLSAREFVTGYSFDVDIHCQQPFGQYVEPHEDDEITNTMASRTSPCICLGSTGNLRGTQKVLNLTTGQVVRRRNLRKQSLPVPDRIIKQVNELGIKNKKEEYGRKLEFLDRSKCPYAWTYEEEDDDSNENPMIEFTSHPEMAAEVPGVTWADDADDLPDLTTPTDDDDSSVDSDDSDGDDEFTDDPDYMEVDESTGMDPVESAGVGPDDLDTEFPGVAEDAIESSADVSDEYDAGDDDNGADFSPVENAADPDGPTGVERHDDVATPTPTYAEAVSGTRSMIARNSSLLSPGALEHVTGVSRYPRRARTQATKAYEPTMSGQSYPTAESAAMFFQESTVQTPLLSEAESKEYMIGHIMMQQLFLQKGLKVFGKKGEVAVEKELQQMKDMDAYAPIDPSTLTEEQKKEAINQLMFLTQKRCGRIKARSCADGRKQRRYIRKEDASSPTVALEAIFITLCIEAKERRSAATIDIPGAFLHADNDEDVIMQLRGKLAELMVQIDPELYGKYVVMEGKQKVLYVKAQKACYGLLRSSLLFYLKLKGDLESLGFEFNPYDPCTANKMIDGHQMTVVFHVDDLKVSHKDEKQIDWFANELRKIYGEKLTVNKGKIHDYLGMMIDYTLDGKVQISMIKFIKKIFELFPETISSTAATPASDRLFHIRDEAEAKFLDEERADMFHSIVAMLLFLCMRARRDIQTPVSFLTTRVQKPDEDDWGKLKRVLKYLKGTLYMKLTLEVDNMSILKWWIDASHNVHMDCRGHTGTVFSLGKGAALSSSSKQKMNTRSSCESELVGAHDGLPLVLWCRHFIEAQGYTVDHNILYQDNQSTMLLQRNGRASSTKRTKHIHARYFFIKDKIDKDEIEVIYCPTNEMRADINTKPLQGSPFRVMRSHLMNVAEDYDDELERQRTSELLGGPAKS